MSQTLTALSERARTTPVADHTVASASLLLLAFQENDGISPSRLRYAALAL